MRLLPIHLKDYHVMRKENACCSQGYMVTNWQKLQESNFCWTWGTCIIMYSKTIYWLLHKEFCHHYGNVKAEAKRLLGTLPKGLHCWAGGGFWRPKVSSNHDSFDIWDKETKAAWYWVTQESSKSLLMQNDPVQHFLNCPNAGREVRNTGFN